jgi:cytochrome P450
MLSVSFAAANRDQARFGPDADSFVPDRYVDRPVDHLSFGFGIHRCIGAQLARATARIAVTVVLDELDELRLAPGYEFERAQAVTFRRPTRLHVTFTPFQI